ncbi:MAG: 4Fe-4S binding protein [Deltaproteobacteria bacterium]|nr:4Fe-4S binding protein [Deltaproteobacteria bacterium]
MKWHEDANEALRKVPFFVRQRVRRRVEEAAAAEGSRNVTLKHVQSCRQQFLRRMEDEVRGFQVETCFGSGGCPNRAVDSDDISGKLEEHLQRRDLKAFLKERVNGPLKMHHEFRITMADCPNACSRPQIVDVGLIGGCIPRVTDEACNECGVCVETCRENAVTLEHGTAVIDRAACLLCGECVKNCPTGTLKAGKTGYRILIGGKLGRHPRLGTEIPGVHQPETVIDIVESCLDHYQSNCLKGERFGEILKRAGDREILAVARQSESENSVP